MHCVLVEGTSKRSDQQMSGRTCTNKRVIVDAASTTAEYSGLGAGGGAVHVERSVYACLHVELGVYSCLQVELC